MATWCNNNSLDGTVGSQDPRPELHHATRVLSQLINQKLPIRGSLLGERRCENELKDTEVLREQKN